MTDCHHCHKTIFQSTLPGWGATTGTNACAMRRRYFNPRSPDGERLRECGADSHAAADFNPRSPDGERHAMVDGLQAALVFQSTLPGWGATWFLLHCRQWCGISIHAPRMGSDLHTFQRGGRGDISIHAPRMGSDPVIDARRGRDAISIHAPRMGSDSLSSTMSGVGSGFQSTLPGWGATIW